MQVGDLVKIKPYCINGNELGVVVEPRNVINCVKIALIRTGEVVGSLISNLELVNENR